jgi:L-asparaginase
VEDSPDDAEIIEREIRHAEYRPVMLRIDQRAGFLSALDPPPDIILTDYCMPSFSAQEALAIIHERDLDIPVIVTAAMRNPALTSPDGPGNLLAAVRVACDPWVRAHAKALGVLAVMLDEVYAAADVLKVHPTRLNAFASPQTGPLAALVEDRIVPMSLPVRDAIEAARAKIGKVASGTAQPVALLWMSLDEPGRLIEAMLAASDRLGYRGAVLAVMGGGHTPERMTDSAVRLAAAMPTVVSPRAGGGPMLRQTYGGPSSEIALRKAGLIWGGRLHPLKARVLLETCLRAGLARDTIAEVFDAFG